MSELTSDEQAQDNLYQASVIFNEQIVPLLTGITPSTPLSQEAFAKAYNLKEMISARWDANLLPVMRKLEAANNPPPDPEPEE